MRAIKLHRKGKKKTSKPGELDHIRTSAVLGRGWGDSFLYEGKTVFMATHKITDRSIPKI